MFPARKALQKEREQLRRMTDNRLGYLPIPKMIANVNRHLLGWANYFSIGYPQTAYRQIDHFVLRRLSKHLKRRSQRPFRLPEGKSIYQHLQELGLVRLSVKRMP
jgi:RNA-directed DNA polymerase